MTERRTFSNAERTALWLSADGKCQMCGIELDDTWEADHVYPYSKGGKTDVTNGQALCKPCNRMKKDKVLSDKINLRPFQQLFVDGVINKASRREKVFVAHASAGSGKTLASQSAVDALLRLGIVEQVAVFVPRLNLAAQYELDWEAMRDNLSFETTMKKLVHRTNDYPSLRPRGADGYVTTYQSLCANPKKHLDYVASKPTVIILDEAQQLGYDEQGNDTSKSAYWVEKLGEHAVFIIVMSGTPYRADNKPLLFANYGDDDGTGYCPLIADLEATYRDGVKESYLRRFEYQLANGGYTWNDLTGETVDYSIDTKEGSVYQALQLDGFWQPMLETFVDALDVQQDTVNSRFAGLIACGTQNQARDVSKYLKKYHPRKRVLIAVSDDGEKAHKALRDFKTGRYDILVTVSMAYVGYDYKWINTVLLLTPIRSRGYLMQLVARGLRVLSDVDYGKQHCVVVAPDDPKMQEFIAYMRGESDAGYRIQQELTDEPKSRGGGNAPTLGYASNAFVSELRALGLDPNSDLSPIELEIANQVRRASSLPYAVTEMISIYRMMHQAFGGTSTDEPDGMVQTTGYKKTDHEQIEDARAYVNGKVGSLAYIICDDKSGQGIGRCKTIIWKQLWRVYGSSTSDVDNLDDMRDRARTVLRWIEQEKMDERK